MENKTYPISLRVKMIRETEEYLEAHLGRGGAERGGDEDEARQEEIENPRRADVEDLGSAA
jgi:hypothetical protein